MFPHPPTAESRGEDRRRQRHAMVLRPRWSQRRPRAVQHLVRPLAQDASRLGLDVAGVEEVDVPTSVVGEVGQHLAVHDGVGAALVGTCRCTAMVSGKSAGQARSDSERIGSGNAAASSSSAADVRPDRRRAHVGHQRGERDVVEGVRAPVEQVRATLMVDRRGRQIRLEQLDPPTVDDCVVRRRRDGHGPAEVMGDPKTHATDSASQARCPLHTGAVLWLSCCFRGWHAPGAATPGSRGRLRCWLTMVCAHRASSVDRRCSFGFRVSPRGVGKPKKPTSSKGMRQASSAGSSSGPPASLRGSQSMRHRARPTDPVRASVLCPCGGENEAWSVTTSRAVLAGWRAGPRLRQHPRRCRTGGSRVVAGPSRRRARRTTPRGSSPSPGHRRPRRRWP